jgi:hypothetical protein
MLLIRRRVSVESGGESGRPQERAKAPSPDTSSAVVHSFIELGISGKARKREKEAPRKQQGQQ